MIWNLNTVALLVPLLFLLTGLTITVMIDPYISRRNRIIMLVILALSVTLIAQNLLEDWLTAGPPQWFWRTTVAIYGYIVRPVFLILFLYIIQPEKKHLLAWGLAIVNWGIYMTAYFSHLCFWISSGNGFFRGPLAFTCLYVSVILLGDLLVQSIRNNQTGGNQEKLIPIFTVVMILASVYLDGRVYNDRQPVTFLTVAIVTSSMFYYIWLHLQFAREHEDDLKARQRIQIMLGQIQPHFLYNTLGAIKSTYYDDPELARRAIDQFTDFLRHNMDSLTDDQPISFERELAHVRCYLDLLQLRFGDSLHVEYDLECTDFRIPTLTLQPLVENAVSYGVRKNPKGNGLVIIRTRELPESYEVSVIDNGPGFVPDNVPGDSERSHIGIQNVRSRLHSAIGAELTIRSEPGKGTAAVMILPKGKENA